MARSDMRDFEWDFIKKLLPNKSRGVKRVDDRRVINGILFALRTGIPWRDMPEQYGPWSTIYNRFNRWSKAGIWDKISKPSWILTTSIPSWWIPLRFEPILLPRS